MSKTISGRVWLYGDNVDTDVIIPARHLTMIDPKQLAAHCLEDLDPGFAEKVRPGDIIVAGSNFGCGSSREHAPLAILGAGVAAVAAASFARIFFRNAINVGLPILECPGLVGHISAGERLGIDFASGSLRNLDSGQCFQAQPFPPFLTELIEAGGLVPYTRRLLLERKGGRAAPERTGTP